MSEHNHVVNKQGELDVSKVSDAMDRIDDGEKERILADFDAFQSLFEQANSACREHWIE